MMLYSYDIMSKCWRSAPTERPTFPELQQTFADMLLEEVNYMQLTSLTEYVIPPPPVAVTRLVLCSIFTSHNNGE